MPSKSEKAKQHKRDYDREYQASLRALKKKKEVAKAARAAYMREYRARKNLERLQQASTMSPSEKKMGSSPEPRPTGTMGTPRPPPYRDEPPPVNSNYKQTPTTMNAITIPESMSKAAPADINEYVRNQTLACLVRGNESLARGNEALARGNEALAHSNKNVADQLLAQTRPRRLAAASSPRLLSDSFEDAHVPSSPQAQPSQDLQQADKEPKTSPNTPKTCAVTPIGDFDLDNWSFNDQAHFEDMFAAFLKKFLTIGTSNTEAAWKLFFRFMAFCTVDQGGYYNALFAKDPLPELLANFLRFLHEQGVLQESEMTGKGLKWRIKENYIAALFQIGTHVKYRELDNGVVKLHDVTIVEIDAIDPGLCKIRFNSDGCTMAATIDRIEPPGVQIPKPNNTVPSQEPPTEAMQLSPPVQPQEHESPTTNRVVTPVPFSSINWSTSNLTQDDFNILFDRFYEELGKLKEKDEQVHLILRFVSFAVLYWEGLFDAFFAARMGTPVVSELLGAMAYFKWIDGNNKTGEAVKSLIKNKYFRSIQKGTRLHYRKVDEHGNVSLVEVIIDKAEASCEAQGAFSLRTEDGRVKEVPIERLQVIDYAHLSQI